eukprot:1637125-Prymnesium_polylepis.1
MVDTPRSRDVMPRPSRNQGVLWRNKYSGFDQIFQGRALAGADDKKVGGVVTAAPAVARLQYLA